MADESDPLIVGRGDMHPGTGAHRHTQHWNWRPSITPYEGSLRGQVRRFQTSKVGHYSVLGLVALDVSGIFADFLITIFLCERQCSADGRNGRADSEGLEKAGEALGLLSLVFSCLFMVELVLSVWAFGLRYFKSYFHCFDAVVIIAGFIIDVCLKGVLEEAGSIIVILRLWRVFKIIEELGAGAEEQLDSVNEHIEHLLAENADLKKQIATLKAGVADSSFRGS